MIAEPERNFAQLILTLDIHRSVTSDDLSMLLGTGKFASVILYDSRDDENYFQKQAEQFVPTIQNYGVAALIAGDTRIAGRVKADGVHFEGSVDDLKTAMEQRQHDFIFGFGNFRDRHTAMAAGELQPDYLFFGKLGADKNANAHQRNLNLAKWWSELIEIPAIIQAGAALSSIADARATDSEFIAVENLIFDSHDKATVLSQIRDFIDNWENECR